MTRHDYETGPLRLVLVDDHEFARAAVATSLAAQPGLEVVGEAGSVAVARALVELVEPDVAILDLNLPDGNGGELLDWYSKERPELRCVIFTSAVTEREKERLLSKGADAVILKTLRGSDLVDAIRQVRPSNDDAGANLPNA